MMNPDTSVILIGCGQMGSAIVRGLAAHDGPTPSLYLCDTSAHQALTLAAELDATARTLEELDGISNTGARVFLVAVKPHDVREVLEALSFRAGDIIISVAAGLTHDSLTAWVDHENVHIVRAMPNTPCLVRQGVTGVFSRSEQALDLATELFECVGRVITLKREAHFHGLTALSGSGPAYVFVMLEALADGGVLAGLDRATARTLAVETLAGAAALVKAGEVHTAELKDRVASPGGTTIAGLRELERHGLRHALICAVEAAAQRSQEMGS